MSKKRFFYIVIGFLILALGSCYFDADIFAMSLLQRTLKIIVLATGIYFMIKGFRKEKHNEQK